MRPVYCEAGSFPILHGSSIFNRGDTQVSIDALVAQELDTCALIVLV